MSREDGSARNFRTRVSRTFDKASPFYGFFDFFSRGVLTEVAVRLSRIVPMGPQTVILEVFCATGLFSRILARTGARTVAVDISPGMIRRAVREAGFLHIDFFVGDAADLPFSDDSFDLVVAGRGLHGMPRQVRDRVVTEIRRVSAGHVLFMEPRRPASILGRAVMGVLERLEGGYENYLEFISTDFKIYLSAMGFVPRDLLLKDNEHVILCRKGR
ncbi:MAG: class I SAM-dependent methyltransferase [Deltaproteobacteria bacterium]|nr:class I SAM-dependent methyltransferase [Candidatus Zymogenaceae bacterium]